MIAVFIKGEPDMHGGLTAWRGRIEVCFYKPRNTRVCTANHEKLRREAGKRGKDSEGCRGHVALLAS